MTTDRLNKACLAMIVLLLGIMTYTHSMRIVRAAAPAEYMVEGNSGQETTVLNAHMKRASEGWTLHTFGSSYLVLTCNNTVLY